ncbi:TVP38/TMEM64 family protein [Halorubrum sp. DTA46]|uniref:TVP38/TMEM64 family protein n=1 Tax=Halorubrum sp. DTA46 TaxID=3402162 RepID=UPI003AAC18AC
MNRRSAVGGYVVAGAAIAAVAAIALAASPDAVVRPVNRLVAYPLGFGVALLALAAVRPFLAWPNTLLAVAVGYGYGWGGVPFAVALLTLTALPTYWLARSGRVRARAELQVVDRLCGAGERLATTAGGVRSVAATRLFPIPSDAVSIGAGASGIRTRPFLLGTALGELPWAIVGVAVGVSVERLATPTGSLSGIEPGAVIAMAGAGVLLLAGPAYRALVDGNSAPPA